jgi:hypothetical protein
MGKPMKRCHGITEPFWTALSEDRRLIWKYASRGIGLLLALLVAKTGNAWFDWSLSALTAIFLMIAIETQRSYSKYSPRWRKANIRLLIFLGSWGIAFIGIAYFSQAAFIASVRVFVDDVGPALGRRHDALFPSVLLAMFAIATPIAVIRVVRQLSIEQLIYHLPRQGLKNLFMRRPHKATSFATFAGIELALLAVCLMYASTVAMLAKSFMLIVGTASAG